MGKKNQGEGNEKYLDKAVKLLLNAIERGDSEDIVKYRKYIKSLIADAGGKIPKRFEEVLSRIL